MKMKTKIDTKCKIWVDVLGNYQIVGGVIGIVITMINLGKLLQADYGIIFFLVFCAMFSYSIYCGVILHVGDYDKGLFLSKINQILQVVQIAVGGIIFKFHSGFGITEYYYLDAGYFTTSIDLSTVNMYFMEVDDPVVGVNFVALGLVALIFYLEKNIEN